MRKLLLITILNILISYCYAQTIHFVAVADVADTSFALVSNRGITQVSQIFETIAYNLNYNYNNKITAFRKEFNSASVISKIEGLNTSSNDIIVLYYSGKPNYIDQGKYPFLSLNDMNERQLSMDELGDRLLKKGTKLALLIADCRNAKVNLEIPEKPRQDMRPIAIIANKNKVIIENLINSTCGLVKIASNLEGQKAHVVRPIKMAEVGEPPKWKANVDPNYHSVFSYAFYDVFDYILKESNESITFPDLIRAIQYRMNYELNPTTATNRKQTLKWQIIPCAEKPDSQSFIWTNVPNTYASLEKKLDQLIDIEDNATRKEFSQNLAYAFDSKNTVTYKVKRKIKPEISANNKVEQEFTNLKSYLSRISNYNPKIQSIKVRQVSALSNSILPFNTIYLEEFYNY